MAFEDFTQVLQESFDPSASALRITGALISVNEVGVSGWTVPNPIAVSGSSLTAAIINFPAVQAVSGSALTSTIAGTANVNVVDSLAISSIVAVSVSGTTSVSGSALTSTIAGTANVNVSNFPATQGVSGGVSATIVNAGTAVTVKQLSVQAASSDVGLVTNSIIHGVTTGGGGGYVDVKVTPAGALAGDVSGSTIAVTSLPAIGISGTVSVSGNALTAAIAGTANVNVVDSLAVSSLPAINQFTILGYASSTVLTSPTSIQSSTGIIQTIGTVPSNVKAVRIADTVGNFLAIYIASTASPAFVIEPGMADQLPYINSASAAVSARYLENVSPTAGYTLIEWLG